MGNTLYMFVSATECREVSLNGNVIHLMEVVKSYLQKYVFQKKQKT